MAESTNRILFAIVILLFALVLKQVSTGMDIVVLLIGLAGLGAGWYDLSAEPHEAGEEPRRLFRPTHVAAWQRVTLCARGVYLPR